MNLFIVEIKNDGSVKTRLKKPHVH